MTPKQSSSSLYQFALGAIVLYLVMKHIPHGVEIGTMILIGVLLTTPDAVKALQNGLKFLETGT